VKVIVQIPCFNEAKTLPATLRELPRTLSGVAAVEWLVIDDGSTDDTAAVARAHGVHHIVRFPENRGLAHAFEAGLDACLKLGADVIVNTDGDNQYCGADIAALVAPILAGRAEMVIGDRQVARIAHFSWLKKRLQLLGSGVVRKLSGTTVQDATSGFRAFSRDLALSLQLTNQFTYTLETVIQAGAARRAVTSVPVRTNEKLRESRLFRGIGQYVARSTGIMVRVYAMHRPLRVFALAALPFFLVAFVLGARFLYHYLVEPEVSRHIQSLVVAGVFTVVGRCSSSLG
jgi:glycosyltransferase involved in cell wall biosynthesis